MGISWASDIKIKQFKNPKLSTRLGLQLWWRSRSEIKSFYRTESSSDLVGPKGSPGLIQKLTMSSVPIWLRLLTKNKNHKICDGNRVFLMQTRVSTLLAVEFSTFSLDIQTGISWASDIKIKRFKSPKLSTRSGLQLWWRSQSEIKLF